MSVVIVMNRAQQFLVGIRPMLLNFLHKEAALVDLSLCFCVQSMLCLVASEEIPEDGSLKQTLFIIKFVITIAPQIIVFIHHILLIFIT